MPKFLRDGNAGTDRKIEPPFVGQFVDFPRRKIPQLDAHTRRGRLNFSKTADIMPAIIEGA